MLARDKIRAALGGRPPDKIVHAGGRLVNLVVRATRLRPSGARSMAAAEPLARQAGLTSGD